MTLAPTKATAEQVAKYREEVGRSWRSDGVRTIRRESVEREVGIGSGCVYEVALLESDGTYSIIIDEGTEGANYVWAMTDRLNALTSLSDFYEAMGHFRCDLSVGLLTSRAILISWGKNLRW